MEALATAPRRNGWPGVGGQAVVATRTGPPWVTMISSAPGCVAAIWGGARLTRSYVAATLSPPGGWSKGLSHRTSSPVRHPAVRARWPAHLFSFERAKRLLPQARVKFHRQPKQAGDDAGGLRGPGQVAGHDEGGSGGLHGENLSGLGGLLSPRLGEAGSLRGLALDSASHVPAALPVSDQPQSSRRPPLCRLNALSLSRPVLLADRFRPWPAACLRHEHLLSVIGTPLPAR